MTTETVLTDEQIQWIGSGARLSEYGGALAFARAIERAVLQSPEVQQRMEAYAAARVQEVLHEEAKPDNIKRAEYYGEGYADGWKAALEQAAQLCDAQHFGGDNDDDLGWTSCAANLAHAIRALIPSTPA